MRKIKFKVWDKRLKKMYWGCCNFMLDLNGNLYWQSGDSPPDMVNSKDNYEILQFTGLFDKNKKEIYEKDIVIEVFQVEGQADDIFEGIVNWWDCGFFVKTKEFGQISLTDSSDILEIIGNIYEK